MTIRFPRIHIAESVSNRILNMADGVPNTTALPMAPPIQPDVPAAGAALDAQLQTPPVPTELPAGADGALIGSALTGDDLSMAAIDPLIAPAG